MKLIVGLGNKGDKYIGTRHNAGFSFVDRLACTKELSSAGECLTFSNNDKFEAMIAETNHKGEKIILAKPLTYMNLSGQAVSKILNFYKAELADLIVVSDDVDLPVGTARIRHEGSSGGQKGLQSIIDTLGDDAFTRIRIGIKANDDKIGDTTDISSKIETADFVLSKFTKREMPLVESIIDDAIEYLLLYLGEKESMPAHSLGIKEDSL